ncbi:MAG: UvrD-helicase domain-containing protein [Spirochaetales bacterium]|jgi:ATP-dependent helicase/nuclease subunit A|nr:UvrD-helicase domain-containing protein [Spirochaetales bacterium]
MSCEEILGKLSGDQRLAATAEHNVVVAAGAGSGKTKTLAARYAWLVMEKGLTVDQILTLTFTNKAVNEMYSRIHGMLEAHRDQPRAGAALADFHKARISTLDSFCAGIARTAARRYGISPDFAVDDSGVRELALEAALPFVLDNRENPALQALLANKKIQIIAEELFARTVLSYGFVTSPPDFAGFLRNQEEKILEEWKQTIQATARRCGVIMGEMPKITDRGRLYLHVQQALACPIPPEPDTGPLLDTSPDPAARETAKQRLRAYFDFLSRLSSANLRYGGAEYAVLKEALKQLRESAGKLAVLANSILQKDITEAIFHLLTKFFGEFDNKKRHAGILCFNDISRLAVDALANHPDIRAVYRDSIKAIMIDEFQDNNGLQRDLIFLLSEKPGRQEKGVPGPGELDSSKMFFVGDEKQSIYRFRGADVSVFRSLAKTLDAGAGGRPALNLKNNYRSKAILIEAFNRIFGGIGPEGEQTASAGKPEAVFLSPVNGSSEVPDFEAAYTRMYSPEEVSAEDRLTPPVHFCFLDRGRMPRADKAALTCHDLEAAFIVRRIKQMVDSRLLIKRRKDSGVTLEPCGYTDFVILQRTYSHQHSLEKFCKDFGVPFSADKPAGLFTDAPINDVYMLLRLLAYPRDRLAYAAVIRSPFARLGDLSLAACMLDEGEPFRAELAQGLPPAEQELYSETAARYRELAQAARTLSVSDLVTRLWYNEGCRYETLWSAPAQVYTELFDVLFKLAQDIDNRGKSLTDFLEYLQALATKEEKPDDQDIPCEGAAGVRIMSIHKSKGLEFPVVFICGGASGGSRRGNSDPIYFHEKWGVSLNLPQAEELPDPCGNFFYALQQDEERKKTEAELSRLLYVAMTRAESCLYFTASLPEQTREEKKLKDLSAMEYSDELIRERLALLREKKIADRNKHEGEKYSSFLDLLLPVLSSQDSRRPFTIEAVPLHTRGELRALAAPAGAEKQTLVSMEAAAAGAAGLYEKARTIEPSAALPVSIPASSLHYTEDEYAQAEFDFSGGDQADKAKPPAGEESLEAILKKAKLEAADFGTIVHSFLETRISGRPAFIPPKMRARLEDEEAQAVRLAAEKMTQDFLDSDLGRLSLASGCRQTEFSILTMVKVRGADGKEKSAPVTGQIDLLFEADNFMHVVDFKTDSAQDPGRHIGQLAVYARAVSDIYGKPVRAWLFYLRTARAEELTRDLQKADIEKIAQTYVRTANLNPD